MQDDEIELPVDELPEELDNTHESMIIQGSIDALDGNESYAVKYLGGVLLAEGLVPAGKVYGSESVWSAVKSGFNNSITYIKKVFTGIWGFFFGKESDAKDEAVNVEVEKDKSELTKLPAGAELAEASKTAVVSAASRVSAFSASVKDKVSKGIDKAKILAEDADLQGKLEAALTKLSDIAHRGAEEGKKQGRSIALAVSIRAAIWKMYFVEFRGVMSSQVKSLAAKTQAEIGRLEGLVKSASEGASESVKAKLASLKENMKIYSAIQQLKTTFRSYVTGAMAKMKASFFKKKEA